MGVQINGSTGAVTGTQSDWSGNVSIGGTLTYEDVTNIDAVGLVTARSGIEIGARPGVAASISSDGNMIVSGISTFGGNLNVNGSSSPQILNAPTDATPAYFVGDSNRTGAGQHLAEFKGRWNGNDVARIVFLAGSDTTNKDDGVIRVDTTPSGGSSTERLRILDNGKIFVGAYTAGDDFSDVGTFLNFRNNSYGGRIGFSNNTATADVALMEQFAYWGSNKVAGIIASAGTDTTNKDDGYLKFYTRPSGGAVAERIRIDTSGRVMIGDSDTDNAVTDSDNLVIGAASGDNGMTIVSQSGNYNGSIRFSDGANTGTAAYMGTIQYYHGDNYMRFYTNGSEAVRISSGHQLSVNTTSTNSQFTISSASAANAVSIRNTTLGNGHVGILFSTQDHSGGREKAAIYHVETHGAAHYKGDIAFCLNTASGGATQVSLSDEKMRVTSSGELKFASGSRAANTNGICASNGNSIDFNGSEYMYFRTANTERARFYADGSWSMGCTQSNPDTTSSVQGVAWSSNKFRASRNNDPCMQMNRFSGTGHICGFNYNGTQRGQITTDGTVIAYQTSSDYRLKENQIPFSNGILLLKQLKPYTFNFIESPDKRDQGFFAHEVQSVVPGAVTGDKDAVYSEDNESEGTKSGDIIAQGLDYGKLTPLLTAALQEAIAKIETLETEVAALKSS